MFLFALYFDKFVKKTQRKYYNQGNCHCFELGGLYNQVNFAKSKEAMLFETSTDISPSPRLAAVPSHGGPICNIHRHYSKDKFSNFNDNLQLTDGKTPYSV